jgi:hypothetical protein
MLLAPCTTSLNFCRTLDRALHISPPLLSASANSHLRLSTSDARMSAMPTTMLRSRSENFVGSLASYTDTSSGSSGGDGSGGGFGPARAPADTAGIGLRLLISCSNTAGLV